MNDDIRTTRARTAFPRTPHRAQGLPWMIYLASPLLLGLIAKVFPLDRLRSGLVLGSVLMVLVAVGWLLESRLRKVAVAGTGVILLVAMLCLPFVALQGSTRAPADIRPAYSYVDAKADPAAFAKWWNLFVDEVVRTNAIVLERDPRGTPFNGELPYRPIPGANANFHRGRISINSLGYRGDDVSREKGRDVYRIVAVGDSTTFGQTLFPDSLPWPARLQRVIAQDLVCDRRIEVLNGGVNGYRLRNAIDRIRNDFDWLKPDLVLSYFGWNTMIDLGINPVPPPSLQPPKSTDQWSVVRWYVRKASSDFVSSMRSRIASSADEFLGVTDRSDDGDTRLLLAAARKSILHADYLSFIDQSGRLGHRLAFLSFNTAVTNDSPEDVKAFYQSITHAFRPLLKQVEIHDLMLREVARETGTPFLDTGTDLHGNYDEDLYIDAVHFTSKGDMRLARNVFRELRPLLIAEPRLRCRPR